MARSVLGSLPREVGSRVRQGQGLWDVSTWPHATATRRRRPWSPGWRRRGAA